MMLRRDVILLIMCCVLAFAATVYALPEATVTVTLTETSEAFPNPMKGFRPSRYIQNSEFPAGEYVTVVKQYIMYTDLESSPDDDADKIRTWSDAMWEGIEDRNLKVIPRVVIVYPNGPYGGEYWPDGLSGRSQVYRWLTDAYKSRMRAFIAKLGEAWDDDPRVAAIEIGLWGQWGEHHISPLQLPNRGGDRIPYDIQLVIGTAVQNAFKNKKALVRYPETFTNHDFGYHWDSFALPDDKQSGDRIIRRQIWRTQMISGEVAYDWGDQTDLGGSPNGTLSSAAHTDYVIGWIERSHASSLGWIAEYSPLAPNVAENAVRMQKALGYRFVVDSATYTSEVEPGDTLSLSFDVRNIGNAPFYYAWPVQVSLMNAKHELFWSALAHIDIRNWLPGGPYTMADSFALPDDLPHGGYTLALAVLDPAGGLPSLRFANEQYFTGGYTPLGGVSVGGAAVPANSNSYDSLYKDRSLRYIVGGETVETPEDTQTYPPIEEEVILEEINAVYVPGNLAFQKPVTVSSTETQYDNYAPKATDGDPATRWSSEWDIDPSWIAVDLEDEHIIDHVNLIWEWSYAEHYKIQVSPDGEEWTDVYETEEGRGNREEIFFDPVQTRHVRVFLIKRALQWGYSLYEVEVFAARR